MDEFRKFYFKPFLNSMEARGENIKFTIIDSFLDDREFRNYIHGILMKNKFTNVAI